MHAAQVHQFGGPEVIKIEKISIPKPLNGQILVKVHAAGVNPVDTYVRSGGFSSKLQFPFTLGFDGAGTVEDVGDLVKKFKKGDRVYFQEAVTGSYAEYAVVDEVNSFPLPSNTGFVEGAGLGIPYFTAYRSIVHKCNAKPGEIMLVHGASGAVGIACCQIGKAMGLKVFGTAGTKEGLDIVLQNGAHAAFNHNESDYFDKILQASGGGGVDLIMEMIANKNLEKDFLLSKVKARIVVIGARDVTEITPFHILYKELQVFGVLLFLATKEELDEMSAYIFSGLEQGYLRPITGQQFALEDVAKAHHEVIEHHQGTKGKIVLKIV